MKKTLLCLSGALIAFICSAQGMQPVRLNPPDLGKEASLMKAFEQRKSERTFSDRELSLQDLSDLLWAANGFNRPDKRTAPTAMNMQEIDVWVLTREGAYLYDAKANELKPVTDKDLRPGVTRGLEADKIAPVCLLITADMKRVRNDNEDMRRMTAYDAGIVSQNIYLYCAGVGLSTVCRAGMDKKVLSEGLGLGEEYILHLNHPVGFPK